MAFIDPIGQYHGQTQQQVSQICHQAELLVNVSGGCWFARPEYEHLTKIFVDTDPGFHQMRIVQEAKMDKEKTGFESVREFFASYDRLFTWGSNINDPKCRIAKTPFHWEPTLPPIVLDSWPVKGIHSTAPYTTVFSWGNNSFSDQEKSKSRGILPFIDLPEKVSQRIVLALGGNAPLDFLRQHGWEVTDAIQTSLDPDGYQSFIQNSKAELGFAKTLYVESLGGWFSDRSACYLASGRPVVAQETGFSKTLPTGNGLFAFRSVGDILAAMKCIERDYPTSLPIG